MRVRFVGLTLCLMCYPVHIEPIEPPSSPPAVKVPPPHQSRIAGRVRSHLPQWKKDRRALAHQGHHGRYSSSVDGGPPTVQSPLRFGDTSAKPLKGIRRMQQDITTLSRNRLGGSIIKSARDRWSLTNILSSGKEGHGQGQTHL